MAEEDLIFGKNRHFFGGIEPSNMQNFTAAIEGEHVKNYSAASCRHGYQWANAFAP